MNWSFSARSGRGFSIPHFRSKSSRNLLRALFVCVLAGCGSPVLVSAQAITIDTSGRATTSSNPSSNVDRRYRQIEPTNISLPATQLDPKTRLELIRFLQSDQGFAMRPFPRGHKGLTLVANGKTLETKQVKVPANGRATVEFLTLDAPYGMTKCEVRIDGADAFPDDDRWLFAVERTDPKPALLVHTANDVNSPLYIRTALEAATEPAFTLDVQTPEQATGATLSKYAFVILSDTGPLQQRLQDNLDKYVQDGGSVLISLGKNAVAGSKLPAAGIQVLNIHTMMLEHEHALTAAQIDETNARYDVLIQQSNLSFQMGLLR